MDEHHSDWLIKSSLKTICIHIPKKLLAWTFFTTKNLFQAILSIAWKTTPQIRSHTNPKHSILLNGLQKRFSELLLIGKWAIGKMISAREQKANFMKHFIDHRHISHKITEYPIESLQLKWSSVGIVGQLPLNFIDCTVVKMKHCMIWNINNVVPKLRCD